MPSTADHADTRARELLAAACYRTVEEMHYDQYGVVTLTAALDAIVAALEAGRSGEAVLVPRKFVDAAKNYVRCSTDMGLSPYIKENGLNRDKSPWAEFLDECRALPAAPQQPPPVGDREADRRLFPDPSFNNWLDDGISDCGHTVYDAVGDVQSAWQGWQAREYYAPHQQPAASVSDAIRDVHGKVIRLLASLVTMSVPDELCERELLPRDRVMETVMRIREAMNELSAPSQQEAAPTVNINGIDSRLIGGAAPSVSGCDCAILVQGHAAALAGHLPTCPERNDPAPVSEPAASDLPIPGEIGSKLVDAASGEGVVEIRKRELSPEWEALITRLYGLLCGKPVAVTHEIEDTIRRLTTTGQLPDLLRMHARDCFRAADMSTDAVLSKEQIAAMADVMEQAARRLTGERDHG